MIYFFVEPEVAGNISKSEFIDRSARPPRIKKLVYQFDGWLGDDIVEGIATYIVTERLMVAIKEAALSGVEFVNVETFVSELFIDIYGERKLPKFYWLKVLGRTIENDFSMSPAHRLIISFKALKFLQAFNLNHTDIKQVK